MKRIYILVWVAVSFPASSKPLSAQGKNGSVADPPPPIPYAYVREADVAWSKQVWRVIDLREKINHPLFYPANETMNRNSLFDVIRKGILAGELKAYDPTPSVFSAGDEFNISLSYPDAQKALTREEIIWQEDTATGDTRQATVREKISSPDIVQYRIKEEWFFDRQRSAMDVRITGIAPVVETRDEHGEFKGYKVLFWLWFPECRNYFAKFRCYNPYNNAEWRSFDEVFRKRLFGSFVSMGSNVYNRPVMAYAQGMEAMLESDRIKDDLFRFEQDLWHY